MSVLDFKIPRKNLQEMVLYVWKIIDLPLINQEDLLYKLSFDLFLFSPEQANKFISDAIKKGYLLQVENDNLKLSEELQSKLKTWQLERRKFIQEKFKAIRESKKLMEGVYKDSKSDFNTVYKVFVDSATLKKTATISNSDINLVKFDTDEGIIKAKIKGREKGFYDILLDISNKQLRHDCNDFVSRKAKNKKFCKHLAKFFLYLKKEDEKSTTFFLENIRDNIDEWEFSG